MMKTVLIAAASMAVGALLCYIMCGAFARKYQRLYRALKKEHKVGMGKMDKILVFEGVVLILYTVADLAVFWHTGSEPAALTSCVFGVCGLENGVMGWIKTNKDKIGGEKPPENTEGM